MSNYFSFFFLLLIVSCASFNFRSPERWVENNTLYSTKLPTIEIKVSPHILYKNVEENAEITRNSSDGSIPKHPTQIAEESYLFSDVSGKKRLSILIESLSSTNWHMVPPDYSKNSDVLVSDSEIIGGMKFAVGIQRIIKDGKPRLVKRFGAVAGQSARYSIIYSEDSYKELINKPEKLLSTDEWNVIYAFNKQANESFTVTTYNGEVLPPNKAK